LSLSIAFFRIFGLSWWSIFDGLLGLGSLVMTAVGLAGYWRATRMVSTLEGRMPAEEG
jgi:urea transporter